VDNFITEQVEYKSKDGTRVTMFLLSRKDVKKDGEKPMLLTGYGGFNISMTPYFSATYVSWLEMGGMVAIPNLRGGGEYGKEWHEAGKLEKKQNVFDDFIMAAEFLINEKYTNPKKLAISGGSNGGLLVGAVTMQRPELFRVVDCQVPLLDMLRYHRFSIANTWAVEYGSSESLEQFEYIYKYSPYHNIRENIKYPAMLITTSENDSRVDPMHALKMVAKVQEVNPNGEPIFLLVRKDSGHGGGTTISNIIEQLSEEIAFLMEKVCIN
jgi:prolyl oligopeptidase